jgi:hypothetical protein
MLLCLCENVCIQKQVLLHAYIQVGRKGGGGHHTHTEFIDTDFNICEYN